MRNLWGDLETWSDIPIKHGTYKYIEAVEVLLFAWAIDDGPVSVWDVISGEPCPAELEEAVHDPECLWWFQNGGKFDFPVLTAAMPWIAAVVPPVRRRDTMVQAYSHSLPGSLEALGDALGVAVDKRKAKNGKALMRLFCIPPAKNLKRERATAASHPADWAEFKDYATQDIIAMRECHHRMPAWNYRGKQLLLEQVDLRINARGMRMDIDLAHAAVRATDIAKRGLAKRTKQLTDDEVGAATQVDEMLKHILSTYGVDLPDMQKDTIERRASDESLPEELRELLRVRLASATTSVSKFTSLLNGVSADGRLRGTKQFRGAGRTGRVGHRMFQPGNMRRPDMKAHEIEWAIQLMKLDAVHLVYGNVMKVCANAIRGTIIADKGKKLVVADLANIEGRTAAWLAGEEWKLQAFRDYDTIIPDLFDTKGKPARKGLDLYLVAYASSFNVPVESIDTDTIEGFNQRQIGKVCLAKGSLVLTDVGLVPIEQVTMRMKVWDGIDWVRHAGVVCNGTKEVITYDGVTATPDHKVWIHGSTKPVPLAQAASSGALLVESGADWRPIRVVGCDVPDPPLHKRMERPLRTRAVPGLWGRALDFGRELGERCKHLMQRLRARAPDSRMALAAVGTGATALHESESTRLEGLRWAGDRISVRLSDTSRPLPDREFRAPGSVDGSRSPGERRPLRRGQSSLGDKTAKPAQHAARKTHVYDIVNAGPRHRFTADGKLVSNCELMFQYGGGVGAWITGAATYGIDLDQMTEQVSDVLPTWAKKEAEEYLQYLYSPHVERYRKQRLKIDALYAVASEEHNEKLAALVALLESRKLKSRLMLSEKTFITCDAIKRLWRRAHPEISSMWKELENAIRACIETPGIQLTVRRLKVRRDGAWLRVGLPSGRVLCYPAPAWDFVIPAKDGKPAVRFDGFSYMGIHQYKKTWTRIGSYGGKVFENATQAAACDQLLECQPEIEDAGFEIVLDIHDENICEVPIERDDLNPELLGEMMCADLGWNAGLPLAAAGWQGFRFHKE